MEIIKKIKGKAMAAGFTPEINRKIAGIALASVVCGLVLMPELAMAAGPALKGSGQSIGDISKNLTDSLSGAASVITALAYLGAVGFGFIGALKWKAYGEQPDRTPLKVPLTYWGVAVLCAALPEFIGTGITSIFGDSADLVDAI